MILGVGSDLIDIRRIEQAIERFGDRFLDRIFTEVERRRCDRRGLTRGASYARRFAAKEAAAKALGTGFRDGVFWRDLGVVNQPSGQPGMRLTGGALRRLDAITPPGMTGAPTSASQTSRRSPRTAVVIITALPAEATQDA